MIEFYSQLDKNEGTEPADTNGIVEYLRDNSFSAEAVQQVVDGMVRSEAVGIEMEYGWDGPEGRTPVGAKPVLFIPENDVLPTLGERYLTPSDVLMSLLENKGNPDAIGFLADMMEI